LKNIVSYVGSRKSETVKRSIRPATYIDSEAGLLTHAVCYKFPKLLEYLYIWYRAKLPLFRDYMLGIERVSCVTCPFKSCHEIKIGAQEYPEVYELWLPYIKKLLRSMLRDDKDVEKALQVHLWRFYLLHSDAQYIARKIGVKLVEPYRMQLNAIQDAISVTSLEKNKIALKIKVRHKDRLLLLRNIATVLFPDIRTDVYKKNSINTLSIFSPGLSLEVQEDGTILAEFSQDSAELLINVLKLCYMVLSCLECEHCIYNCPENAINIPFSIDPAKCSKCLRCLDACVPARYLFDMIIMSEITSIKYARERMEKIREKYKEILIRTRLESDIEWLKW
jgi:phosphoadenosine phosphosulfate reductase